MTDCPDGCEWIEYDISLHALTQTKGGFMKYEHICIRCGSRWGHSNCQMTEYGKLLRGRNVCWECGKPSDALDPAIYSPWNEDVRLEVCATGKTGEKVYEYEDSFKGWVKRVRREEKQS